MQTARALGKLSMPASLALLQEAPSTARTDGYVESRDLEIRAHLDWSSRRIVRGKEQSWES